MTQTDEGRTVVISARLRAVLEMVRTDPTTDKDHKPTAFVFGNAAGESVGSPKKAWEVCVLKAHGIKPEWDKAKKRLAPEARQQLAAINLHFHDLRHEAGSRWIEAGWPIHHVQARWAGFPNQDDPDTRHHASSVPSTVLEIWRQHPILSCRERRKVYPVPGSVRRKAPGQKKLRLISNRGYVSSRSSNPNHFAGYKMLHAFPKPRLAPIAPPIILFARSCW